MKLNVIIPLTITLALAACSSRKAEPPPVPMVEQTDEVDPSKTGFSSFKTCALCDPRESGGSIGTKDAGYISHQSGLIIGGIAVARSLQAIGSLKGFFKDSKKKKARCREMELLLNGNKEGTKVDESGRLLIKAGPDYYRVHPFVSWNFYHNHCVFNR